MGPSLLSTAWQLPDVDVDQVRRSSGYGTVQVDQLEETIRRTEREVELLEASVAQSTVYMSTDRGNVRESSSSVRIRRDDMEQLLFLSTINCYLQLLSSVEY